MVAIIVVSSLISLSRGFVKEALSLLTWIVAGAVAWMFGGALAQHLGEYIQTPSARIIAACALLFIATLLLGALVNYLIGELIRVTGLSGTDRFLGMVFGGARGVLLVVLLVGLLSLAPVQQDPWWQQSVLMPHFLMVADWSKNFILGFAGQWLPAAPITPPSGIGGLLPQPVILAGHWPRPGPAVFQGGASMARRRRHRTCREPVGGEGRRFAGASGPRGPGQLDGPGRTDRASHLSSLSQVGVASHVWHRRYRGQVERQSGAV